MARGLFDQVILRPFPIALTAICLYFAWPVGAAMLFYILFARRLGWEKPTGLFLSGLRSGLKSGASCCGPSIFFFSPGICKADQARPAGLATHDDSSRQRDVSP